MARRKQAKNKSAPAPIVSREGQLLAAYPEAILLQQESSLTDRNWSIFVDAINNHVNTPGTELPDAGTFLGVHGSQWELSLDKYLYQEQILELWDPCKRQKWVYQGDLMRNDGLSIRYLAQKTVLFLIRIHTTGRRSRHIAEHIQAETSGQGTVAAKPDQPESSEAVRDPAKDWEGVYNGTGL